MRLLCRCEARGNPQPTITWLKDGQQVIRTGSSSSIIQSCVYMCILYSYTYTYMCLHVFTCVYMCLHVFTCVYMCLHVYTCVFMCIHVLHVFTCVYMYIHVHTCVYMCLHLYTCVHQVTTAPTDPNSHRVLLPAGHLFFLRAVRGKREDDRGTYWCRYKTLPYFYKFQTAHFISELQMLTAQ